MFPNLPMWLDIILSGIAIVSMIAAAFALCLLLALGVALVAAIPGAIAGALENRRFSGGKKDERTRQVP